MSSPAPDFRDYNSLPILNVPSAVALVRALLAAAPKQQKPLVRRARKALEEALEALVALWEPSTTPVEPGIDRRPFDQALDRCWGALYRRLSAWLELDAERHPEVARAAELRSTLFLDSGLAFLRRSFREQWAESERRLRVIDKGLAAELDALLGSPAFLEDLRAAHAAYGQVLGITAPAAQPTADPAALTAPLHALRAAIFAYVGKLIGTLDEEDADEVAAVRAALAPIDALRLAAGRSRASSSSSSAAPTPAAQPTLSEPEPAS